eukprot:5769501-Pyramimonas_sp.AAC.1
MNESSSDALENLNKAEERQRKWVSDAQIRSRAALAGCTSINSQPGAVLSWRPDSASAQPPACHGPYFQYVEPPKLRFIDWPKSKHGDNAPTAAQWWPLIWTPDLDQYARPMRCSALA